MRRIAVLLLFVFGNAAYAGEFSTCYARIVVPNSTRNLQVVLDSLPYYGLLGPSTNPGVVLQFLKENKGVKVTIDRDSTTASYFLVKFEGTQAAASVDLIRSAVVSSLRSAKSLLIQVTPQRDQKFLSVVLNGCSTSPALYEHLEIE